MTYDEKYSYWEMISDYDTETASAMISAGRWMYVATLCYSSIERLLKGLIIYQTHKEAPKSDNLVFLMNRLADNPGFCVSEDGIRFRDQRSGWLDSIIDITYYHINDYPFSYQKIMDRFITEETAHEIYDKAAEIIKWLKSFGPKNQ